jgi:hypothetical protein
MSPIGALILVLLLLAILGAPYGAYATCRSD